MVCLTLSPTVGIIIALLVLVTVVRLILSPIMGMVMGIPTVDILTDIPMGITMDMATIMDMAIVILIPIRLSYSAYMVIS